MADDLAAVLTILHESEGRWRTLRAEGDQWSDPDRSREAFLRVVPEGSIVSSRGTPGPADHDPTWSLWLDPPRFRTDFGGPHGSRMLIIGDGRRVAFSNPATDLLRVSDQREDNPHVGPPTELLRTTSLPSVLHLDVQGRRRVLDRDAYMVRGRPRHQREADGPRAFMGADEVELTLDAERGILLSVEQRLDGAPFRRVTMTTVAFDEDLEPALFEFTEGTDMARPAAPVSGGRRPPAPHRPGGPPDAVLGQQVGGLTVIARTDTMVVAVDRIVAYPNGFEAGITIRTNDRPAHGSFDDHRRRSWSGSAAFPGESIRVTVVFADGRRGTVGNFTSAPAGDLTLVPIQGVGSQTRFDQRFWVEPLPPPGPLRVLVEWERRGLPETRAELDAGAILEAATKAEALWS